MKIAMLKKKKQLNSREQCMYCRNHFTKINEVTMTIYLQNLHAYSPVGQ